MGKYVIMFRNYFSGIKSVDIIYLENETQVCYPLILGEQNIWSIQLNEKPQMYQLGLNRMFPINQIGTNYVKVNNQTFSVFGSVDPYINDEPIEVSECYTFSIDVLNKINKRAIFYYTDQVIFVNLLLKSLYTGLIAVEWINPEGELVFATDSYLEKENQFQSFFILNQDYLVEGLWTVNIYGNGHQIVSKKFNLRNETSLVNRYVTN